MKTKFILYSLLVFGLQFLFACRGNQNKNEMAGPNEYFTCSMDPQVIENHSGLCPVCHMQLIKVNKNSLKPGQILLSDQQIKLAEIKFDTVQMKLIRNEIHVTGKVTADETQSKIISSLSNGVIENLSVKNQGDQIHKGQLLYTIRSTELYSAQQEYIDLINENANQQMIDAAKNKLLLMGVSAADVSAITVSKKPVNSLHVYASDDGFINEIFIGDGTYIEKGSALFKTTSQNKLWIDALVNLSDINQIHLNDSAIINIPSATSQKFFGSIIFISPAVELPNHFVSVRIQVENNSGLLKPGMFADISVYQGDSTALAVSTDALIQMHNHSFVWTRNDSGTFEIKQVETGISNSTLVEIISGLKPGDRVVSSGVYLLNSEFIFKKGANENASMATNKMEMQN